MERHANSSRFEQSGDVVDIDARETSTLILFYPIGMKIEEFVRILLNHSMYSLLGLGLSSFNQSWSFWCSTSNGA